MLSGWKLISPVLCSILVFSLSIETTLAIMIVFGPFSKPPRVLRCLLTSLLAFLNLYDSASLVSTHPKRSIYASHIRAALESATVSHWDKKGNFWRKTPITLVHFYGIFCGYVKSARSSQAPLFAE